MVKTPLVFFVCLFFQLAVKAQSDSFYIDSANNCYFTDDAIYFHFTHGMVKSDYSGNIIWTKHIDALPPGNFNPNFAFMNDAFYGNTDSSVYKIDTSGNTIWIKHLANLVNPIVGATQMCTNVTTDGKRVFVGGGEQSVNSFYKIQVTLDTAGNMINAWSSTMFIPGTDYAFVGVKTANENGAWIANVHVMGITSAFTVFKADSSGLINTTDSTVVNGGAQGVAVSDLILAPDSNYVITATHGILNGLESVSLAKFNDAGAVLWTHMLGSNAMFSNFSLCEAIAITADSSNAIYFLGKFMDSSMSLYERPLILKFDSIGNLIWSKSWSDALLSSTPFSISKMHFHNGMIYTFGNAGGIPSIVVFDTSFINLCYSPDTTFGFFINDFGTSSTGSIQQPAFAYTPNTILPIPSTLLINQPSTIFCSLSTTADINFDNDFACYPNPFNNELFILKKVSTAGKLSILLMDILGETVLKKEFNIGNIPRSIHLETTDIPPGLYILQVTCNDKIKCIKIVK